MDPFQGFWDAGWYTRVKKYTTVLCKEFQILLCDGAVFDDFYAGFLNCFFKIDNKFNEKKNY